MTSTETTSILRKHLPHLRAEHGVRALLVFGSVARNAATPASDVDMLVEFNRPTGFFGLFRLQDDLVAILGSPVDLGTPAALKPAVRERALREGIRVE